MDILCVLFAGFPGPAWGANLFGLPFDPFGLLVSYLSLAAARDLLFPRPRGAPAPRLAGAFAYKVSLAQLSSG